MKIYQSLALGIFLSVVLAGCGSKLTPVNFERVRDNMSPKQVKEILGNPTSTETSTMPIIGTEIMTYKYRDKKAEAEIIFRDNKMSVKSGNFSE
jgi:hypothetical protein